MDFEVITFVRKWGNSLGVVLSKKEAEKHKIHPQDRVIVRIEKVSHLRDIFGTLKTKKTGQKIKEEMRAGWE